MTEKKEIDWNLRLALSVIAGFAVLIGIAAWRRRFLGFGVETDFIGRYQVEAARFLERKPLQLTYHPPLYTMLVALAYGLIRDWARAGYAISWIAGVGAAFFSWHAYRRLLGPYAAWGSVVGLVGSATFLTMTASAASDVPAVALHGLCFFLVVMALDSKRDADWFWAGSAAGAAIMTRVETFPLLLLGFAVWRRGERLSATGAKALRFLAGVAALPALWLVYALFTGSRLFPKGLIDLVALSFSPLKNDRFSGDALNQVSGQFSSISNVLGHDPRRMAGIIWGNVQSAVIRNQPRLLIFPLMTLVLPGYLFLWFRLCRRGIWAAVVLLSPFLIQTLALGFIVYTDRYHLFMIPLMGAGVGLCLEQARRSLPQETTAGKRAALAVPALAILIPLMFAASATIASVSANLRFDDAELEEAVSATREHTPEDAILVARKPHIGFYAGRKFRLFPAARTAEELREWLRALAAEMHMPLFVYYGSTEMEYRPDLAALRFSAQGLPWLQPVASGRNVGWTLYRYRGEGSVAERPRVAVPRTLVANPQSADEWLSVSNYHLQRKEFAQALKAAKEAQRLEKSPRTNQQLFMVYREM